MLPNWYLTKIEHEQRIKEIQRSAQLRRLAHANRQSSHWLSNAVSRLQRTLATVRPHQRRQTDLPKRTRGATA